MTHHKLCLMLCLLLIPAASCSDDDSASSDAGATPKTVEVRYQDLGHEVELSQPDPVLLDDTAYARLSDVVKLALPNENQANLRADFVAGDGFKPADSSNCKGLTPVAGSALAKGYVQLTSRNVRWDDELSYPGCMGIKDLAQILLTSQ